jgi:hypothetical protein
VKRNTVEDDWRKFRAEIDPEVKAKLPRETFTAVREASAKQEWGGKKPRAPHRRKFDL